MNSKQLQYSRAYRMTFTGMLNDMYWYMLRRVTEGGLSPKIYKGLPLMARRSFFKISMRSAKLHRLYDTWITGGCKLVDRPTPNRVNGKKGYISGNIRFLSYSQNTKQARKQTKNDAKNSVVLKIEPPNRG